jgi:hypothetical protein
MTKQILGNMVVGLACIALVASMVIAGSAADKINYSGKYALQGRKAAVSDSTLEVIQDQDNVEVIRVERGRKTTNRYPLDGSDEDCTSSGGVPGKCKAQLKDKYLVLESVIAVSPQPNAPSIRIHTKERWQLSADSKTLTVKSNVDFPDAPAEVSGVVGAEVSGTEKYTRIQNP